MRHLWLCLLLAACAKPEPAPLPSPIYRDLTQLIGSTTRGGPGDMAGDWVVQAAFPGGPVDPGGMIALAFAADGTGSINDLPLTVSGPGRWRAGEAEFWLLWVDDDFRTAVIGTPTGAFGWIMDRPGAASSDRTRAARDVLDFSGYDLAQLQGEAS